MWLLSKSNYKPLKKNWDWLALRRIVNFQQKYRVGTLSNNFLFLLKFFLGNKVKFAIILYSGVTVCIYDLFNCKLSRFQELSFTYIVIFFIILYLCFNNYTPYTYSLIFTLRMVGYSIVIPLAILCFNYGKSCFLFLILKQNIFNNIAYNIKTTPLCSNQARNKNLNMKQISLRAAFLHSSRLNRVPRYCQETRYLSPSARVRGWRPSTVV